MKPRKLKTYLKKGIIEAGCDEAGRGCLAGPVYAAAVILPRGFRHKTLTDSKLIDEKTRYALRDEIEKKALGWSVAWVDNQKIDEINILNASFLAMHLAVKQLKIKPQLLLIDGNRFKEYPGIPHECIIKGDSLYYSIAAASILAKTYRDDYMRKLHEEFNGYGWHTNKGYATKFHREAVIRIGMSPYHRKSFHLKELQLQLEFKE